LIDFADDERGGDRPYACSWLVHGRSCCPPFGCRHAG
jgi:hypothetical protein